MPQGNWVGTLQVAYWPDLAPPRPADRTGRAAPVTVYSPAHAHTAHSRDPTTHMTRAGPPDTGDAALLSAELPDLVRRRQLLGLDVSRLDPERPPLDRHVTGLAFSGGGVRAGALALGVSQALARHGRLARFDYLSTVSGGGFIGATISSWLGNLGPQDRRAEEGDFAFRLGQGLPEPAALSHLRTHADYLAPEGAPGRLRLAAVLLRGVLLNVFLFLPWVLIAVVLTEIVYELEARLGVRHITWRVTLTLALLGCALVATFPFVTRVARRRFTWARRNAYDMLFAGAMVATITAIALLPFSQLTRTLVVASRHALRADIAHRLAALDRPAVWLALAALATLWVGMHGRSAMVRRINQAIGRLALWLLAPVLLLTAYFVLCAHFVHLPFAPLHLGGTAAREARADLAAGRIPTALRVAIDRLLGDEGGQLSPGATVQRDAATGALWVHDAMQGDPAGPDWLFGASNGPGGSRDVARFPVRVLDRAPGDLDLIVTLRAYPEPRDLLVLGALVLFLLVNGRIVDVNVTSLHQFYRDRLSRAFLLRPAGAMPAGNDGQRLSDLNASGLAPYHLVNATLNVSGSANPLARGRNADFFLLSRHVCGSRCTGYVATADLEQADPRFDFASAIAISAAAAGPRMGVHTSGSLAGDLALFNLRLGYWLPNPLRVGEHRRAYRFRGPGASYLLRESFGLLHEASRYVNVSDGGHIENLGIYELLRRRCRVIVALDAECDPELTCEALTTVIRYARIDLGITIEVDLSPLRRDGDGWSAEHLAVGTIRYGPGLDETGLLVYLKASRTGDEAADLAAYARRHPAFPHQSTADQFFTEADFEAYRALGDHIVTQAMRTGSPAAAAFGALDRGGP